MDNKEVKIYAEHDSPRLRYIASVILGDILGLNWDIVTDRRKLGKHPVINYSVRKINGSFSILPSELLFQSGIRSHEIRIAEWRSLPVLFPGAEGYDIPFDIFAASFYLITRYEEYLDFIPDEFGRFRASDSIAYKESFLGKPVVDLWAREMAKVMLKKFPMLTIKRNEFNSMITIDLDEPFLNSGSSLLKSIEGFFRERKGSKTATTPLKAKQNGHEKDPYDVFGYITENLVKSSSGSLLFFPVGDHSDYDKNPSWKNEEYRKLIKELSEKFRSGLHPSFKSAIKNQLLVSEYQRLNMITEKKIRVNRFHYLRLFFPSSYRMLLQSGIEEDYSMGYPDEPGFRAGIARPFCFYDVAADVHTKLKIFPFQIMDDTLFGKMKLDHEKSKSIITQLYGETKHAGGMFISVWHNTYLLDNDECRKNRLLFEMLVKN